MKCNYFEFEFDNPFLPPPTPLGGRYVDSLFVVTWDMHLVEYELLVAPSEAGDKAGQVS